MDLDKIIETNFSWDKKEYILNELPHEACVKFAIYCAEQVIHLCDLDEAQKAIDTAKLYLEGKASREECYAAAAAAYSAANAAYAAATAAAYAAYAANAAATYATVAAAHAADNAVTSVVNSASATAISVNDTKVAQMNFLRNLILDNLTEEQKENWLLVANI